MEKYNYEDELKSLRSLVVRLAGEIDYKNHMLMENVEKNATIVEKLEEKEVLLTERSIAISVLVAENVEKDRLLVEKSEVITSLTEDKEHMLLETTAAMNMLKEEKERLINESSAATTALMSQYTEKDRLIEEKEKILKETLALLNILEIEKESGVKEKSAEISSLIVQNAEKERLIDEKSAAIKNLMVEKDQWLHAYLKELAKIEKMKPEVEKLQLDFEVQKKKLDGLTKEQIEMAHDTRTAETEIVQSCVEAPKIESDHHPQELVVSNLEEEQICSMLTTQNLEDLRAEVNILKQEMEEKVEALQNLEMDNRTLTIKELRSNHELQAARRAAIEGLQAMQRTRVNIGIKRIGEVDPKPFRDACSMRFYSGDWDEEFGNWEEKSMELCSSWQRNISDPGWLPFKQEVVNGKLTEVIDESDQSLKELKEEWGEEVYNSVADALLGVNEFDASGRYPVAELWNFKENRRATLGEVIQYVIKQWRIHKKK